jgi:diaminohydroxyphosphoribosylaminopyrimidine deaminase/5-amino-6-(5-phosphoribosylamino)uracil reductase
LTKSRSKLLSDTALMERALVNADAVRGSTAPNPWVGAVLQTLDGEIFEGGTQPVGEDHAERVAIKMAAAKAKGATVATTLEPCCHQGRTAPCTEALIEAQVARVVVGLTDPDENVNGQGIADLRKAGIEVIEGVLEEKVAEQLAPYLHHRRTGKPWVVLKMALTLDGRSSAADGSSQWITGEAARADAHLLRARCDGILVGAQTVRSDNPSLTVRHVTGKDPIRIVLGIAPPDAAIHPCWEVDGDFEKVLQLLGERGIVDLLVEGGANVASNVHRAGLVNEYVFYLAPALMGGDDGRPLFTGAGAPTIGDLRRGRITSARMVGEDVRIDLRMAAPNTSTEGI